MKKGLIILAILLAIGGIVFWQARRHAAAHNEELVLHGNIDIREVNLGFRVSGRIDEVLQDEGDAVAKGEPLARLDPAPYRRALDQANAQVDALTAAFQKMTNGNRPEEIVQAEADLQARQAALADAEQAYHRQQELLRGKVAAQQEFDTAEAQFNQATAETSAAQASLALLQAGFRKEGIAQAGAELARAQAQAGTAAIQLEDTTLLAPAEGVVITRALEPGAIAQAGATVLTVSLTRPVWARVYVEEPDLGKVHPGLEVRVFTDSRPGQPYHGKVGYISPRAEFTPKNVETEALRAALVYRLRVVIDDADPALRQGMPVTVRLSRE